MAIVTLRKRAEFQRIRGGVKVGTRGFMIEAKVRPAVAPGAPNSVEGARFGFTITKKVGNAVERNHIRRRLKEALRKVPVSIAGSRMDYVVIARRTVLELSFADIVADFETALRRIGSASRPSARSTGQTSSNGS